MAETQIKGNQVKDGTIQRADLDVSTSGSAVVAKIVAGTGITLSSTGPDAGTGDVTINASGGGSGPFSQQVDLTSTDVNDTSGAAQDIGGSITLAANQLGVGVGLLFSIEARVKTAPTGANQSPTVDILMDGTLYVSRAALWTILSSETTSVTKRSLRHAAVITVENASGNNVDLVIVTPSNGAAAHFPGGHLGNAAMASSTPATAALAQLRIPSIDKTATHTFKFQITFGNTGLGCVVTPAIVRLLRLSNS